MLFATFWPKASKPNITAVVVALNPGIAPLIKSSPLTISMAVEINSNDKICRFRLISSKFIIIKVAAPATAATIKPIGPVKAAKPTDNKGNI